MNIHSSANGAEVGDEARLFHERRGHGDEMVFNKTGAMLSLLQIHYVFNMDVTTSMLRCSNR